MSNLQINNRTGGAYYPDLIHSIPTWHQLNDFIENFFANWPYHIIELSCGMFNHSFSLPVSIDDEVLRIILKNAY